MDTSPISSLSKDVADEQQQPNSVFSPTAFPPRPASRHSPDLGGRFDRSLFQAYFPADKILEVINPNNDLVWVHDFLPTCAMMKWINEKFGNPGYEPVVLINPLQFYEKITYYMVAECCLVSMMRDEISLILRQGNEKLDEALGMSSWTPKKSMLVVSEFIGCSPSLNSASWVDPWNVDAVSDAMDSTSDMTEPEKQLRHDKQYR